MPIGKCRICDHEFFKQPLLLLKNMPRSAQYLPDQESLAGDFRVDLELVQCTGCGLVQLTNSPVPYYREVIRASAFSPEMENFRIAQFNDFIQKNNLKNKKIIEIGCGKGEYLSLLKKFDLSAYGLEYSDKSVKHCSNNNLNVSKGFIESGSYKLNHAPFDAFFILNYLEHLPDPNTVIRGIYHNSSDGAAGLVEVPNFDMIMEKKLVAEISSDHLLYFTKETLRFALRRNGFEILDCQEVWYNYIISATVKKRGLNEISYFYNHQKKIRNELEKYILRFGAGHVAIWGAGHQAFTVISLASLADKIKYLVDSASFKQGKYTPSTHLPIVSPEMLNRDPVDAVIVMAAGYSDEVATVLKRDFNKIKNIAILRDYGLEIV